MKRLLLIILVDLWVTLNYGQEYLTEYPIVQNTNCSFCRIAKVILTNNETKVLIEVDGQPKKKIILKF